MMPVLLERVSLVVRREALRPAPRGPVGAGAGPGHDREPAGPDPGAGAWARALGARRACTDGELVALSYDRPAALSSALRALDTAGLQPVRGGEPGEVALVDQGAGPALWWPWLELAVVRGPDGGAVLAARRAGTRAGGLAVPEGWRYGGSPSEVHGVGPLRTADRPLRHLRREPEGDVFADRWTGEEVRLRRSAPPVRVALEAGGCRLGEVAAEVSSRDEEVEVGLMFREALGADEGMLFRFPRPRIHEFWMKNTPVPLDVVFVGPGGTVVNVAERAEPLRLRPHRSAGPVRDVLEVRGGWCREHGVGPGARLDVAAGGR
jgi:hypothetical protein